MDAIKHDQNQPHQGRYLTEKELGSYVRISPASIRRLVRNQCIPYIVLPLGEGGRRTIRFKTAAIDKWLESHHRKPSRKARG